MNVKPGGKHAHMRNGGIGAEGRKPFRSENSAFVEAKGKQAILKE
jgi:hypothetical protein